MVIDGTGAPPAGPMNVVVERNRIARITSAGTPGVAPRAGAPPPPTGPDVIDGTGMYLMPGFVNLHAHLGDNRKAPEAEYVYKLYMAHGVTTLRGVELAPQPFALKEKERSAANAIVAPRIFNYQRPGAGWSEGVVDTPEKARAWVRWCAANGVDGMKLVAYPPRIMAALLDEAKKHGLGSTAHLEQRGVAQMNALTAAKLGLGTVTHFYGHFEALLRDFEVQPWPDQHELQRRAAALRPGRAALGSDPSARQPRVEGVPAGARQARHHLRSDDDGVCRGPRRDADAQRRLARALHAAVADGVLHAEPREPRLVLLRLDAQRRGRLAQLLPGLVQAAQRLQEDGRPRDGERRCRVHLQHVGIRLHPRDDAAAGSRLPSARGHPRRDDARRRGAARAERRSSRSSASSAPGMLADLVLVDQNPLQNLLVLYGTGHLRLNDRTGRNERVGGIRYTIKDGIVYDAKKLLADVAAMVEAQKKQRPPTSR